MTPRIQIELSLHALACEADRLCELAARYPSLMCEGDLENIRTVELTLRAFREHLILEAAE